MVRMRTIKKAIAELREVDMDCCVSEYWLRCAVKVGTIPSVMAGNKALINFDKLLEYLGNN
jgi:hypothetical protein